MPAFFLLFFHIQPQFFKTNFNINNNIKLKLYTSDFQKKLHHAMTKKIYMPMFQQGPTAVTFVPKSEIQHFSVWYTKNKYANSSKNYTNNSNDLQFLLLGGFYFKKNKNTYSTYYLNYYQLNQKLNASEVFKNGSYLFEHEFINIFEQLIFLKCISISNTFIVPHYYLYNSLLSKQ